MTGTSASEAFIIISNKLKLFCYFVEVSFLMPTWAVNLWTLKSKNFSKKLSEAWNPWTATMTKLFTWEKVTIRTPNAWVFYDFTCKPSCILQIRTNKRFQGFLIVGWLRIRLSRETPGTRSLCKSPVPQ
jgi:hypothetical protein